jgi:hypothetical protein
MKGKTRTAIAQALEEGDPKNFTANKGPKASYINKLVGETVPSNVREEIWDEFLEKGVDVPGQESELNNDIT